jgi:hypothetical protein
LGIDLDDPFEATPAEQRAGAVRDDEGWRPTQNLERGKVQVIVVKVGDEYPVESVEHPSVCKSRYWSVELFFTFELALRACRSLRTSLLRGVSFPIESPFARRTFLTSIVAGLDPGVRSTYL